MHFCNFAVKSYSVIGVATDIRVDGKFNSTFLRSLFLNSMAKELL